MNKEDVVHIHNGILFSHEKKNPTICNNMEGIMLSYISPVDKKQVSNDFTYLWSIRTKQKLKEQNSNTLTEPTKD